MPVTCALVVLLILAISGCAERYETPDLPPVARPEAQAQERPVRLVAVGDVLLADAVQEKLDEFGYRYPLRQLRGLVAGHDLLIGNLEGPITDHAEPISSKKDFVYKMDAQAAIALRDFGFDLFDLANNHVLDYGMDGMRDTWQALDRMGIGHFGSGLDLDEAIHGKIVEVAGLRIGFLGFMQRWSGYVSDYPFYAQEGVPGVPLATPKVLKAAIVPMRDKVDTLVVSFHWGRNYSDVRANQVRMGRLAVDLGADLVIGHNSHNLQGVEIYRQVPILYSLGNFTFGTTGRFDTMADPLWQHGWVADIKIAKGRAAEVALIPIATNNLVVDFQPRPADPALLEDILALVNRKFDTRLQVTGGRAIWALEGQ